MTGRARTGLGVALVMAVVLAAGVVAWLVLPSGSTPTAGPVRPSPTGAPTSPRPPKTPPAAGVVPPPRSTPPPLLAKPRGGNGHVRGRSHSSTLRVEIARDPIRVTQANIRLGLPWRKAHSDLSHLVVPGTDIVGLNEAGPSRVRDIQQWISTQPGWHYYAPPTTLSRYQTDDTIAWNDANLSLIRAGSVYGSPSRTPKFRITSRWITWAEFEHKPTHTKLFYLQTHDDPGSEHHGQPASPVVVRDDLTYLDRLRSLAGQFARSGLVIVGGDWNVDARADEQVGSPDLPYGVLSGGGSGPLLTSYQALGFTIPPTSPGSHRWIDYLSIWNRFRPGAPTLRFVAQYTRTHVYSDHNPLIADLTLTKTSLLGLGGIARRLAKSSRHHR